MDKAEQILEYLEALAQELIARGVKTSYHMLVSGGAWMLLQKRRRSTHDIDFALVIPSLGRPMVNVLMGVTVQRGGEIATRASDTVFRHAALAVAAVYRLPDDWINDESAGYLYDDAPVADVYLWRTFGDVLSIYLPTAEYIFALKVAAYRAKDRSDIRSLLKQLKVSTLDEARAVVERILLPESFQFWEVEKKLRRIFRS